MQEILYAVGDLPFGKRADIEKYLPTFPYPAVIEVATYDRPSGNISAAASGQDLAAADSGGGDRLARTGNPWTVASDATAGDHFV
jgi:hypothetical protein